MFNIGFTIFMIRYFLFKKLIKKFYCYLLRNESRGLLENILTIDNCYVLHTQKRDVISRWYFTLCKNNTYVIKQPSPISYFFNFFMKIYERKSNV
jgi:hypothetical protein